VQRARSRRALLALPGHASCAYRPYHTALTFDQAANLAPDAREEAAPECADVLLFLIRLADKLNIDLAAAAKKKLELNTLKYPVEKSRGGG
jgi:NTP pyrophosphatase (non-canonical NTP hydrolase)